MRAEDSIMCYPSERVTRFIVLFVGRSGSAYLIETLGSHSRIRAEGEQLVGLKRLSSAAQTQWTREFFTLPDHAPYGAVGFKAKLSDVLDADEFADLLRSMQVRVIHLERHNVAKQAVSWLNAERLYETTGAWNLYRAEDRLAPLEVDLGKFADYLAVLEQAKRRLRKYVGNLGLPVLPISYEDLLVDYQHTIIRSLEFLEIPPGSVESQVQKATDDNLRLAISNFADLRDQYAGTDYESMLDEVLVSDSPIDGQRPQALHRSETVQKFVVLFQGRSGSTHLVHALRSHSKIQSRFEVLVSLKEEGAAAQAQWMQGFFTLPSLVPFTAIGFKTKLTDVVDVDGFGNLLRSLDVRIIHLDRRNLVKQAVSWLNSERLHEATGNWNLYREADRLPALEIDLAKFADYLHLLEQGKQRLRQYVDELAQPTLHITYEDLLLDFEGTMAQVLDFLGTPPERVVSGAKKITSDDLRLAVSNFWELRAQYAGTAYEPMFDEVLTEAPACSASLATGEPAPFRTQGGEETANVIDSGSIARTNLGRGKKPDYERFIILGQERTGSNLLLLLLSSHPNARTFGEVFNPSEDVRRRSIGPARPPDLAENPAEYLANCIYRAYPEHIRAVGFKLFYSHARNKEWKAAWAYLRRTGVRVIHITRRNLLDRYLSLQLALSSEEWIALDGNESTYYEPIPLNAKACLRDFQRSVSLQQRMDQFFVHNPKITVVYEDLCDDMAGECQRVQAFLGLEPMTLSSTLKKQRTQSKREIIANFDDLKETLAAWVSKGWAKEEWLGFFEEEACD